MQQQKCLAHNNNSNILTTQTRMRKQTNQLPIGLSNNSISSDPSSELDRNIEVNLPSDMPKIIVTGAMNSKETITTEHGHEENGGSRVYEELRTLKQENKSLRMLNKELKGQLEDFSRRLDESLKKQSSSQRKTKLGQQIVENMELRNAYKMCDIYKKEIATLKRREEEGKEGRVDDLENRNFELTKEKQRLLLEIKDLKKTIKQHQKGFKQLAGPNALKLLQQNQKLKQSIRRLQVLYSTKQSQPSQFPQPKKKQARPTEAEQIQNEVELQKLRNKLIKSNRKVTILMSQNQKLKEYTEELRNQLIDKDKDILQFRERLAQLRNRQDRQEEVKRKRVETEPEYKQKHTMMERRAPSRQAQKHYSSRHNKIKSDLQPVASLANPKKDSLSQLHLKYPKVIQKGQKNPMALKWNHHQFSSKIKEIQVSPHPQGHIRQLNLRYEKGEPPRNSRNKFASFCCEENSGEYITVIRGGFKDGLLRYLVVETNKGRKCNFCQFQLEEECSNFQFSCGEGEYLGALFGENTAEGVSRLGCFVELKK